MPQLGILALQGNYESHQRVLENLGVSCLLVYKPEDLLTIDGLIIPGGESSALLNLLEYNKLDDAIIAFARTGKGIFGTCAGAILLAKTVHSPSQTSLGLIDIEVERNAYGRQINSTIVTGKLEAKIFTQSCTEMFFIRAPVIRQYSSQVTPLAWYEDDVVMVKQDNIIVATFHPELSSDNIIHQYFINSL